MFIFPKEENPKLYIEYLTYIFFSMAIETLLKLWILWGLFGTYLALTFILGVALVFKKKILFVFVCMLTVPCIIAEVYYTFVLAYSIAGVSLTVNLIFVMLCIVFLVYVAFLSYWLYVFYRDTTANEGMDEEPYTFRESSMKIESQVSRNTRNDFLKESDLGGYKDMI